MILITGATGTVGGQLVDELQGQGADIRALARDPEKARPLEEAGVEVALGDFASPEQLDEALAGVTSVFLNSSQHPQLATLQGNVVEAAKRAGTNRIVKISGGSVLTTQDAPSWVGRAHWETEQQIEGSGIGYTFLRPHYYMKNLLMLAQPIAGGKLPLPLGEARMAIVDTRDVAAVAAAVLTAEGEHDGKVYDLSGPESLDMATVADRLGAVLGLEVTHIDVPLDAAVDTLAKKGAPDWLQQHFREIMTIFGTGSAADTTDTVAELLGREPRSIDDFARDHAEALAPGGVAAT